MINHVWQSTLFAAMAGLLTLAFRKTQAKTRYWLWFAASMKFLAPFSLLVSIGSQIEWRTERAAEQPAWSFVMEHVGRPPAHATVARVQASAIPEILFMLWAVGFVAILFRWWLRSRPLRKALRTAARLDAGAPIEIRSSPARLEPGVFGILRPVLLLPEGITERLTRAQLEAIFAHELCHVRRRDNLAAAAHMVVEAIFWFHPLVWWLGARLVEERERACDEEVLRSGGEPQVYAEGILNVCRFYLESPLVCAAGVTGSNLKKRIEAIMTRRIGRELTFGGKLLLASAGALTVAGPFAIGLLNAPPLHAQTPAAAEAPPAFEVASIKLSDPAARGMRVGYAPGGRFTANGVTVKSLVSFAYGVREFQISGGPSWISSNRYDIVAKAEAGSDADDPRKMATDEQREIFERRQRQRLQGLLADRFQLKLTRDSKELPVYALVIAKNGPKLQASKEEGANRFQGVRMGGPGHLEGAHVPMKFLIQVLSQNVGRPVIDQTGLSGKYDFKLEWTPDQNQPNPFGPGGPGGKDMPPPADPNGPSIFTAIQEQLGLKLNSQKGPVEMLTIDSVEKPSEN